MIKRKVSTLMSLGIALITALLVTSVVWAMSYISETNLTRIMGPTAPITYSSAGCAGGSCRYLNQSSNYSVYHWSYAAAGINNWYAYCPTIGQAAANYQITGEDWAVVMNQASANNQGNYVYLGYSDYTASAALYTGNMCIAGWGCYGLPVYWDNMAYEAR